MPIGVILMAFGGADSPEAIEPFMKNLMGGRIPPPPLVEKIKARYQLIGGRSPLPDITAAQATSLEKILQARGGDFRVEVGMRYWHPFIQEGVDRLLAARADQIVGVSLAPFYSRVSTGAYTNELNRVAASIGDAGVRLALAEPMFNKPKFVQAVKEKIAACLAAIPEDKRKDAAVIFSAHSLPVNDNADEDPYAAQFEALANQLAADLGLGNWHIAYQSKGGGQGEWLGPTVEELMDSLKQSGTEDVLVAPVGFVSDHIETLYDVDIAQKNHAHDLGLNFYRSSSLNTSPIFIEALADLVLETLKGQ